MRFPVIKKKIVLDPKMGICCRTRLTKYIELTPREDFLPFLILEKYYIWRRGLLKVLYLNYYKVISIYKNPDFFI